MSKDQLILECMVILGEIQSLVESNQFSTNLHRDQMIELHKSLRKVKQGIIDQLKKEVTEHAVNNLCPACDSKDVYPVAPDKKGICMGCANCGHSWHKRKEAVS